MNSKEALKDLREVKGWNDVEFNKRLDIIEKDLQRNEAMKVGGIQDLVNEDDKKEWGESTQLHLCPNCKKSVFPFHSSAYNKIKYCEWCGQKLDWETWE